MSVQAIAWALRQRVGSTGGKCLLLALANYADEDGTCFPGQERLADETDQSIDSVQRRLKDLEALGLITRERRGGHGEGRSSDRYKLHLDQLVLDLKPRSREIGNTADCGLAPPATPQAAALQDASTEGATPQEKRSNTAIVRFSTIDEPSVEPSDKHTLLIPQHRPEDGVCASPSVLGQCSVVLAEPERPRARFADLAALWPWEDGESRVQAEGRFERLGQDERRHVLAAAPAYLVARERAKRKRVHLKTFIEELLWQDFPADSTVQLAPKKLFIAVGTQEFAAWDRAYRAAGRPGMPKASSHEGRQGWWRPTLFPAQDWSYQRELAALPKARDGPNAA